LSINLKRAYRSSAFSKLSWCISFIKAKLADNSFLKNLLDRNRKQEESSDNALNRQLSNFYMLNHLIEYINDKIKNTLKTRLMDLYLIFSWTFTYTITCIIYSLEYFALYKINPKSFEFDSSEINYLYFLGFSFSKMSPTASTSKITEIDIYADLICYMQNISTITILFILFFTFLTAARERYKEDIEAITTDLNEILKILQEGSLQIFNLALADIENALMHHDQDLVNGIRTLRGLPKLPEPIEDNLTLSDAENK
jgi:hypothetical protein